MSDLGTRHIETLVALNDAAKEVFQLRADLARAREALEIYADDRNWPFADVFAVSDARPDGAFEARIALATLLSPA